MSFSSIGLALQILIALFGAFFLAFWISLIVWTFRDVRSRSRDIFAQLLATLMVIIFNVPGLVLYFMLRPQETLAEKYERALEEEALLQDIEERYHCPGCKQKIRPDYQFCPSCHAQLKQPCPSCGKLLQLHWALCPYCGATPPPQTSGARLSSAGRVPAVRLKPASSKMRQHPSPQAQRLAREDTIRLTEVSSTEVAMPGGFQVGRPEENASLSVTEPDSDFLSRGEESIEDSLDKL